MCTLVETFVWWRSWASVLIATNSTPRTFVATICATAFAPDPPTPITRIFANVSYGGFTEGIKRFEKTVSSFSDYTFFCGASTGTLQRNYGRRERKNFPTPPPENRAPGSLGNDKCGPRRAAPEASATANTMPKAVA